MADGNSIELFQFTHNFCSKICISVPQSDQNQNYIHNYKFKNLIYPICITQFAMALIAYIAYGKGSLGQICASFLILTMVVIVGITYIINFVQLQDISKFIENCEEFIEKSE